MHFKQAIISGSYIQMLIWDILSSPYASFLHIKKIKFLSKCSKLVLDFTILHIFQTKVIILVKFIQISICDVSCLNI